MSTMAFNNLLIVFLDELVITFPEIKKIEVHRNIYKTIIKTNPKRPKEDFLHHMIKDIDAIFNCREDFFKNPKDKKILEDIESKKWWNDSLSPKTKGAIWKYLQNLFSLALRDVELPNEYKHLQNLQNH